LGWAITFALENGGNGLVISAHDFAMREPFALGQLTRLRLDALMVLQRRVQLAGQALAPRGADLAGVVEMCLGVGSPDDKRFPQCQQMAFGLTHDFDEHSTVPPALAAKAMHGFFQAAHEHVALGLEHPPLGGPR